MHEYNIQISNQPVGELIGQFDAVILGVAHDDFKNLNIREFLKDYEQGVVYDVKGILSRDLIDGRL